MILVYCNLGNPTKTNAKVWSSPEGAFSFLSGITIIILRQGCHFPLEKDHFEIAETFYSIILVFFVFVCRLSIPPQSSRLQKEPQL